MNGQYNGRMGIYGSICHDRRRCHKNPSHWNERLLRTLIRPGEDVRETFVEYKKTSRWYFILIRGTCFMGLIC